MMATALAERMRIHTPGQVTWPEPQLGKTCAECTHFITTRFKTAGKGECYLVKGHQGVAGKGFDGGGGYSLPTIQGGQ